MAAPRFPSHSFEFYQHHQPQWPLETKPKFDEEDESSVLDEKILEPTTPGDLAVMSDGQGGHFGHIGQAVTTNDNMWHEGPPPGGFAQQRQRHHSFPTMPHHEPTPHFLRIDPYAAAYTQPQHYPMSANSGTSTPTPAYEHAPQEYHAMAPDYYHQPFSFNQPPLADHISSTPMSPQSSQGGWMSATSSDTTEPRSRPVRSPSLGVTAPMSHLRSDGIRKKNARFEIPAERNLHNIDSLINQTNDESEKKELKQQKRLLRNRQAALDSRQRKKLHTEKLEIEKKDYERIISDREDQLIHLDQMLQREREEAASQIHHFEQYIRKLEYERDEATRTKTLDTAELRKKNNILMSHIRDLERQQALAMHNNPSSDFANDFSSFDNLGIDDTQWEDDFAIVGSNDINMAQHEHRQVTPQTSAPKVADNKNDMPFSWNAFYMCLLFGAFIASRSSSSTTSAAVQASIPPLSDEYRAESANVLKAVLAASPQASHTLYPSHSAPSGAPTHISGAEMARMSSRPVPGQGGLEHLHASLTMPSRRQEEEAAFAMSSRAYNNLTNPDPFISGDDDDDFEPKPSALQQAYASMQAGRQSVDRILNGNLHQKSLLWEQVPEKVIRDFREMVEHAETVKSEAS